MSIDFSRVDLVFGSYAYGINIYGVPMVWDLKEDKFVRFFRVYDEKLELQSDAILSKDIELDQSSCVLIEKTLNIVC